jgi:hypothetical protein
MEKMFIKKHIIVAKESVMIFEKEISFRRVKL